MVCLIVMTGVMKLIVVHVENRNTNVAMGNALNNPRSATSKLTVLTIQMKLVVSVTRYYILRARQ